MPWRAGWSGSRLAAAVCWESSACGHAARARCQPSWPGGGDLPAHVACRPRLSSCPWCVQEQAPRQVARTAMGPRIRCLSPRAPSGRHADTPSATRTNAKSAQRAEHGRRERTDAVRLHSALRRRVAVRRRGQGYGVANNALEPLDLLRIEEPFSLDLVLSGAGHLENGLDAW